MQGRIGSEGYEKEGKVAEECYVAGAAETPSFTHSAQIRGQLSFSF